MSDPVLYCLAAGLVPVSFIALYWHWRFEIERNRNILMSVDLEQADAKKEFYKSVVEHHEEKQKEAGKRRVSAKVKEWLT